MALRWLIDQNNVLPIPGAKNPQQAEANALALTLAQDEIQSLNDATSAWRR